MFPDWNRDLSTFSFNDVPAPCCRTEKFEENENDCFSSFFLKKKRKKSRQVGSIISLPDRRWLKAFDPGPQTRNEGPQMQGAEHQQKSLLTCSDWPSHFPLFFFFNVFFFFGAFDFGKKMLKKSGKLLSGSI